MNRSLRLSWIIAIVVVSFPQPAEARFCLRILSYVFPSIGSYDRKAGRYLESFEIRHNGLPAGSGTNDYVFEKNGQFTVSVVPPMGVAYQWRSTGPRMQAYRVEASPKGTRLVPDNRGAYTHPVDGQIFKLGEGDYRWKWEYVGNFYVPQVDKLYRKTYRKVPAPLVPSDTEAYEIFAPGLGMVYFFSQTNDGKLITTQEGFTLKNESP